MEHMFASSKGHSLKAQYVEDLLYPTSQVPKPKLALPSPLPKGQGQVWERDIPLITQGVWPWLCQSDILGHTWALGQN